jgi:hypothetical protein
MEEADRLLVYGTREAEPESLTLRAGSPRGGVRRRRPA